MTDARRNSFNGSAKDLSLDESIFLDMEEPPITLGYTQNQSNYGGYGLSLGYGHMTAELSDGSHIGLKYYDQSSVDEEFTVKMYI
ncbi:hypothetical protein AKO1_008585 [Acrasis kona]|uniref:Uncharacterized protein n=1 Tax=Acrasis kona TaxID=1008807 RepID=A0AAW2YMJ3_9EUKA